MIATTTDTTTFLSILREKAGVMSPSVVLTQADIDCLLPLLPVNKPVGHVDVSKCNVQHKLGFDVLPWRRIKGNTPPHTDDANGGTTVVYLDPAESTLVIDGQTFTPRPGERYYIGEDVVHHSVATGTKVMLGPYDQHGGPHRKLNASKGTGKYGDATMGHQAADYYSGNNWELMYNELTDDNGVAILTFGDGDFGMANMEQFGMMAYYDMAIGQFDPTMSHSIFDAEELSAGVYVKPMANVTGEKNALTYENTPTWQETGKKIVVEGGVATFQHSEGTANNRSADANLVTVARSSGGGGRRNTVVIVSVVVGLTMLVIVVVITIVGRRRGWFGW